MSVNRSIIAHTRLAYSGAIHSAYSTLNCVYSLLDVSEMDFSYPTTITRPG